MEGKLTILGVEKLKRYLDTEAISVLRRDMRAFALREAAETRGDIVRYVQDERHGVPNSPLTVAIKGSDKPIVDRGDLVQRIDVETEVVDRPKRWSFSAAAGVRRARRGSRKSFADVATILHEGVVLKVNARVRRAVFAKLKKRGGARGSPTSTRGGGNWIIRGRPFVRVPVETREAAAIAGFIRTFRNAMRGAR